MFNQERLSSFIAVARSIINFGWLIDRHVLDLQFNVLIDCIRNYEMQNTVTMREQEHVENKKQQVEAIDGMIDLDAILVKHRMAIARGESVRREWRARAGASAARGSRGIFVPVRRAAAARAAPRFRTLNPKPAGRGARGRTAKRRRNACARGAGGGGARAARRAIRVAM